MTRPSRNVDRDLIEAGIAMIKEGGVNQLNVREIAKRADANLGMFHYHFKNKDLFARIVLQEIYENVFSNLTHELALARNSTAIIQLRTALMTLARFAREHRALITSMATDLALDTKIMHDFVQRNFPRHATIIYKLLLQCQKEGLIASMPVPQLFGFIASSVFAPMLAAGVLENMKGSDFSWLLPLLEQSVLTDEAIAQRISMALRGVSL